MKKTLFLLLLPACLGAQRQSLTRFQDASLIGLHGPMQSTGLVLAMDAPSPQRGRGRSLQVMAGPQGAGRELRLDLARGGGIPGGQRLRFDSVSLDPQLTLVWKASKPGQGLQLCLENSNWSGTLCAEVAASGSGWQESVIPFVGGSEALSREPGLEPLAAGQLVLRPLGPAKLWIDEIRVGGAAKAPDAAKVARAFGTDESAVHAVRQLGLPEDLAWMLLILDERCRCGAQALVRERSTKAWGEIAQAQGWAWADLIAEMHRRRAAAGLSLPEDSADQRDRVARNDAFAEERP